MVLHVVGICIKMKEFCLYFILKWLVQEVWLYILTKTSFSRTSKNLLIFHEHQLFSVPFSFYFLRKLSKYWFHTKLTKFQRNYNVTTTHVIYLVIVDKVIVFAQFSHVFSREIEFKHGNDKTNRYSTKIISNFGLKNYFIFWIFFVLG